MLFNIGLFDLVRAISNKFEKGAVILCYHRVIEGDLDHYSIPGTQLDKQNFTAQVQGFSRKYKIVSFAVLVDKLKKGLLDRNELVFSFDDGFKDNSTIVIPVLSRCKVPAIFFISPTMPESGFLIWNNRAWFLLNTRNGHGSLHWRGQTLTLKSEFEKLRARDFINQILAPMKEEERATVIKEIADALGSPFRVPENAAIMLNRDDISDMIACSLVEFGSHSMTHPLLPLCDDEQRVKEVSGSKKELEAVLGRPVAYFAYPGGAYDQKTLGSARDAGYEAAVATSEGLVKVGDDLFSLNRINVSRDDDLYSVMIRKLAPLYLKNIVLTLKNRIYGNSRD